VTADFAPAKKAAEDDEKAIGADMAGIHVSHSVRAPATAPVRMRHVRKAKAARQPGLRQQRGLLPFQTLANGTFGTDPRFAFGRGAERRFAFGFGAGSFSGLGVTGPSRNWKPSLSRPCSSLSTTTRTCPPAFS